MNLFPKSKKVKTIYPFLLLLLPFFAHAELSAEQIVQKLEENFATINTYQAKFDQEIRSESFGRSLTKGSGEILYAKPGKMVWHYLKPEEHWYITDGKTFWDYLPSANYVMELKLDQAIPGNLPKGFLFGMAKISDQFSSALSPLQNDNQDYLLILIPKKEEDRILLGSLELLVDRKNFLVKEAKLRDSLGNENHLKFMNIKINQKIDQKIFNFKIPKGTQKISPQPLNQHRDEQKIKQK